MSKIKTLHIEILFIILLSLIFILWGRIFYSELNKPKLIENIITQKEDGVKENITKSQKSKIN